MGNTEFVQIKRLDLFFQTQVETLSNYTIDTRAYITNTLSSLRHDYSKDSLTIIYAKAQETSRFDLYQNIGDWILFVKTLCPDNTDAAISEYYDVLAQNAYYRCYRILNKKWELFEELSDTFPILVKDLRDRFIHSSENRFDNRLF